MELRKKVFLAIIVFFSMFVVNLAFASEIVVNSREEFESALAGDYTTIKVGQNIELAADAGDNALIINRPVTISGGELTFRRGGIVLGANVSFEDITLGFPNSVRNAIFANGYTLILNNVQNSDSCTTSLHVFCGGVTNYNGSNSLPETGSHGNVIIKGSSELGHIFAGSLADDNAANNFLGDATITIDSSFSGTIGDIYAHGAYEPRGTGEGDALSWDTNIDMPYKVSGNVNINVNKLHTLTIDGDTGIDKCASFLYSGSEYVYTPVIKNISQINVNAGHLAPASGSSFKGNNIDISVANGTRLDFSNFGDSVTLNNFSGGGEIVLRQPQTILISGTITGNTSIGIGSITEYEENEKYSNQRPARRHNYIKAPNANSELYSFSIIPWNKEILKMDANGNWLLPDINIIIQSIDVPEVIELPTETTEVAIPITITYENYDEFDTMLCYMPIAISINGNQAIINPDQGYGYSYSMQDDIGITPLEFGFDVDENDNDIEVLSLKGTGFEYKIPDGEYIVRFIIPAGNMSSSNETILETTLKIGHVHSGGTATCVSKAVCSCGQEYGEVDSDAHNYEEDWKSDETEHWHECSLCHEKKDKNNHNPGAEATESTAQKCTTCEYVIVEALGHTHSGGAATCISKAVCSCGQEYGEVDSDAHNYEEDWKSDETEHWHECSLCHEKKDKNNHNPGAEATESRPQQCTICEYVIAEALGHTHSGGTATCISKAVCSCGQEYGEVDSDAHNYEEDWKSDETQHWHECSLCHEKKDEDNHNPGAEATESRPQQCTICEYVIAEALGHTHSGGTATCISKAVCSCGQEYGEVDSNAHNYEEEWKTDETNHWHECSLCHEKKDEANHNPGAEATESTAQKCTTCEYVIVEALGHTHSGGTATCVSKAVCSCGQEYGELNSNNHTGTTEIRDAVEATSRKNGYTGDTYYKCCNLKIKTGKVIPKTGGSNSSGGGSSSSKSENITKDNVTVKTSGKKGSAETTIKTEIEAKNNSVKLEITKEIEESIVDQAKNNDSSAIVIKPEIDGFVRKTEISILGSTMKKIKDKTKAELIIETPIATAVLPRKTIKRLADTNDDINIRIQRYEDNKFELIISIDNKIKNEVAGIELVVPYDDADYGIVAMILNDDGSKEIVKKTTYDDDNVIIPLEGSEKIEIVDNAKDFYDISRDKWHFDAVKFVTSRNLFSGTSDKEFSPNMSMTRGMVAQVLHNFENNPKSLKSGQFYDVREDAWYQSAVSWAVEEGIISGYGDGLFGPKDDVTREQLAVMLWRYSGSPKSNHKLNYFLDKDDISEYAKDALAWANESGIINGKGEKILDPKGKATRAEVAQMLKNMVENN